MKFFRFLKKSLLVSLFIFITSCETIDSTIDSTWDAVTSTGEYIYDSVNFWEDDEEPEQSEAIIIEEAVEVPEYALPDQEYQNQEYQNLNESFSPIPPPMPVPQMAPTYYDPIYRSARQYYLVGPNGTPLLAAPPPPFPQYSIDQAAPIPYSYYNSFNGRAYQPQNGYSDRQTQNAVPAEVSPPRNLPRMLSKEEEMELFGMQNNCIRVKEDEVNGGYECDDFD